MTDVESSFVARLPGYGPFLPNSAVVLPLSSALFVDPATTVPTDVQSGSSAQPFATIQQAVDVLASRGGGSVVLVPGIYPAEAVSVSFTNLSLFGLGGTIGGQVDLVNVTFETDSPLSLQNVSNTGAITSSARVVMRDSFTNSLLTADTLDIYNSTIANFLVDGTVTAYATSFLDGGECNTMISKACSYSTAGNTFVFSGLGQLWDAEFVSDLLANTVEFHACNLNGAFTGSTFTAFGSRLQGGSVTSTVQITLDQFSYQSATPASWVSSNLTVLSDTPWTPQLRQVPWQPAAAPSTLFQVLLANQHPAGTYLIYAPFIVRTVAAAGSATRVITWDAPTIGAQTNTLTSIILTIAGTKAQDVVVVTSTGLEDVTVQYTGVGITGNPQVDVYASALQGGAKPDLP